MDEELQGLHLTYLQPSYDKPCGGTDYMPHAIRNWQSKHPGTDETLPAKKMQNRKQGSISEGRQIHLFPIPKMAVLSLQGIETALAARELYKSLRLGLIRGLKYKRHD